MKRLALLSVHSCPSGRVGEGKTGGMTIYLGALSRYLAAQGVMVDLITQSHPGAEQEPSAVAPNIRLLHVGPVVLDASLDIHKQAAAFARNLSARLDGPRPYDMVHSNYWASGVVGALLAKQWDVPHIVTFHSLAGLKSMAFDANQEHPQRADGERSIARGADAVVAFTQDDCGYIESAFGVQESRIHVIPCGVDISLFRPLPAANAKAALGYAGKQVVLFVGRLEPLKGAYIALQAFAGLGTRHNRKLVMVGGPVVPSEMDSLQSVARRLGIAADVDFVGPVAHEELPRYYAAADVYICPSYYESFGLSILEAMACARPVVTTATGGPGYQVIDHETGFLVARPDQALYAARIEELLAPGATALRTRMGEAGRKVAQRLSWPQMGDRMLGLYHRLCAEAPHGCASSRTTERIEAATEIPTTRRTVPPPQALSASSVTAAARNAGLAAHAFLLGEFAKGHGPNQHAGLDVRVETLIVDELRRAAGNCMVLSEEAGWVKVGEGGGPVFIVDPLDGSNNFFHGIPYWAVVIATAPHGAEGGRVADFEYGIVACCDGTIIEAERGRGILVNGAPYTPATPLIDGELPALRRATTRADKRSARLIGRRFGSLRLLGSASTELAWIALGRLDVFIDGWSLKLTDVGGPAVILREAGIALTDLKGKPLDTYGYDRIKAAGVLAARDPRWHAEMLQAFHEVEAEVANAPPGR